jgi:Protein of unknown function (DUF3071)
MRKLELVGLDSDGRYLVLADEAGDEYVVPADERLRAALRGDRARLGQLEIDMDSVLRPRDIQARIRAGETPEAVAVVAQVSVDKIMPYCVPVLAERRHIADLARRHHVRRKNAEGPARSLDTVVSERLRSRGIDAGDTDWDAWRREDGRWEVRASYQSGERQHRADFVFDAIGRYALADDDEARWLTGEQQSTRKGPQPREGGRSGERRLSSVRTGDDLLSLTGAAPGDELTDDELTDDLTAAVRAVQEAGVDQPREPDLIVVDRYAPQAASDDVDADIGTADDDTAWDDDAGVEGVDAAQADDVDDVDRLVESDAVLEAGDQVGPEASTVPPPPVEQPPVEPAPGRGRRTSRRAAVPSWDEIMLGKRKDDSS